MTNLRLSKHCTEDRLDRLVRIATTIGFGEVILTSEVRGGRECLTDTGVVLIKDLYEEFLITAYVIDINRLTAIYSAHGYTRIPNSIYKTVCRNMRKNIH